MVNNNSPKPYCAVATQARFAGPQDMSVLGVAPGASADGTAHLAIRVGRILLYIEDRGALATWTEAWRRALDLADGVFGPVEDAFAEAERVERRRFERSADRRFQPVR